MAGLPLSIAAPDPSISVRAASAVHLSSRLLLITAITQRCLSSCPSGRPLSLALALAPGLSFLSLGRPILPRPSSKRRFSLFSSFHLSFAVNLPLPRYPTARPLFAPSLSRDQAMASFPGGCPFALDSFGKACVISSQIMKAGH